MSAQIVQHAWRGLFQTLLLELGVDGHMIRGEAGLRMSDDITGHQTLCEVGGGKEVIQA